VSFEFLATGCAHIVALCTMHRYDVAGQRFLGLVLAIALVAEEILGFDVQRDFVFV
jgi:hypothetical protein